MFLRNTLLATFTLMCSFLLADGLSEDTAVSAPFRLEQRTSFGGRLARGEVRISPVAVTENVNARLTIDGKAPQGWSAAAPGWDSRALADGWHAAVLNEGENTASAELAVLNRDDVDIHGGVLTTDETWSADKLHIVQYWVRIPAGKTLTIEDGAVVKFCNLTGIQNDGTLVATGATMTPLEDDSIGGDTDMNGPAVSLSIGGYEITGSGTRTLTNCDIRYYSPLLVNTTWTSGSVNHIYGKLTVPSGVTLTIQRGAIVKLASGAELKAAGGSISASGALFTHIADDSEAAGGDTNGDGDATLPVHDAYKLTGFTPASDCELRYLTLTFAGGTISGTTVMAGNRVHKVTGNITIASGGKLVVQPGAIVKMNKGLMITVNQGGTLEAIGNRAQPIVFTSYRDDDHGGDTDKDGGKDEPQPGDWRVIYIHGTAAMDYCHCCYGGNTSSGGYNDADCGIISVSSTGSINLSNSVVSDSIFEGIKSFGHDVNIDNTIIRYCNRGINTRGNSIHTITNCIAYKCTVGYMEDGPETRVVNSIAYECAERGFWAYYNKMKIRNCLSYSSYASYVHGLTGGQQGNIIQDPLFTDPENGDFTLKAGSPCIDAGDGTVAPEFDYWGKPRMDCPTITNTGVAGATGCVPDIGLYEMPGTGGGDTPDVMVTEIAFDALEYRQGDMLTLTWKDANAGEVDAVAPWRDVVSFVQMTDSGRQVVEATVMTVIASVKRGKETAVTATVKLPAMLPGEWQVQVAANQFRDVYEGGKVDNNTLLSEEAFTLKMAELASGTSTVAVPPGASQTYRLSAVADGGTMLWLESASEADLTVVASNGRIPTAQEYHWKGVAVAGMGWLVEIPKGTAGDVFVTLMNGSEEHAATVDVKTAAAGHMVCGTDYQN